MNTQKSSNHSMIGPDVKGPEKKWLEELAALGTPIGSFGGGTDLVIRIRNGKLIAANAGTQGGGQN